MVRRAVVSAGGGGPSLLSCSRIHCPLGPNCYLSSPSTAGIAQSPTEGRTRRSKLRVQSWVPWDTLSPPFPRHHPPPCHCSPCSLHGAASLGGLPALPPLLALLSSRPGHVCSPKGMGELQALVLATQLHPPSPRGRQSHKIEGAWVPESPVEEALILNHSGSRI